VLARLNLVDMEVPEAAVARLERLPFVEYVERDGPIHLDGELDGSLPADFSAGAGVLSLRAPNRAEPNDAQRPFPARALTCRGVMPKQALKARQKCGRLTNPPR
jgi:hypothetical protein